MALLDFPPDAVKTSHAAMARCRSRMDQTAQRIARSYVLLVRSADRVQRADCRRRDMVPLAPPAMPRPPNAPTEPVHHCPQCHQTLTFHNTRTERSADGNDVTVTVYLCIHHGFFRITDGKGPTTGM
jgi:hypothetical protein